MFFQHLSIKRKIIKKGRKYMGTGLGVPIKREFIMPEYINLAFKNGCTRDEKEVTYIECNHRGRKLAEKKDKDIEHPLKLFRLSNAPESGFLIRNDVGKYSSGWRHKSGHCRLYDPRGFYFDITLENLVYILENTDSIRDAELRGSYVYGWNGDNFVLVPVYSEDYKDAKKENHYHEQHSISEDELTVGVTYLTCQAEKVVYMGRFPYYKPCISFINKHTGESGYVGKLSSAIELDDASGGRLDYKLSGRHIGPRHFFMYVDRASSEDRTQCIYIDAAYDMRIVDELNGWIIKCLDESCSSMYDDMFDSLQHSKYFSPVDMDRTEVVRVGKEDFINRLKNVRDGLYAYSDTGIRYFIRIAECSGEYMHYKVALDTDAFISKKTHGSEQVGDDVHRRFGDESCMKICLCNTGWMSSFTERVYDAGQLYERIKPSYIKVYLQNGSIYKRKRGASV